MLIILSWRPKGGQGPKAPTLNTPLPSITIQALVKLAIRKLSNTKIRLSRSTLNNLTIHNIHDKNAAINNTTFSFFFQNWFPVAKDGSTVRYVQNLRTTYLALWIVLYQRTVLQFNFWSVPYQRNVPVPLQKRRTVLLSKNWGVPYCKKECRNPGWYNDISLPIIWLYPPNNLSMVFICIPSNNLTLVCIWSQVSTWNRGKKVFHFWWRPIFFFGLHLNLEKNVPFFGLLLIYSPEKSRGRGSSPPRLKIGQSWGKIANYLLQCSTKICTIDCNSCF